MVPVARIEAVAVFIDCRRHHPFDQHRVFLDGLGTEPFFYQGVHEFLQRSVRDFRQRFVSQCQNDSAVQQPLIIRDRHRAWWSSATLGKLSHELFCLPRESHCRCRVGFEVRWVVNACRSDFLLQFLIRQCMGSMQTQTHIGTFAASGGVNPETSVGRFLRVPPFTVRAIALIHIPILSCSAAQIVRLRCNPCRSRGRRV